MPLLPASLTESRWVEFAALIESDRPEFCPTHPWGCHRRRVPDRVVFDHVIAALMHGSGDERIASPAARTATIGRRLDDWAAAGVGEQALRTALAGDDPMIGLDLDELSVDGSITKARCPWWRTCARSPGDSTALPPRQHGRAPPCDRSATRADPGPMPPSGIQYVRNSRGQRSRSAG